MKYHQIFIRSGDGSDVTIEATEVILEHNYIRATTLNDFTLLIPYNTIEYIHLSAIEITDEELIKLISFQNHMLKHRQEARITDLHEAYERIAKCEKHKDD